MAPGNDYLMDESVQQQLAAHDNKLIKGSTVWFPGETPTVHWDFNRAKEVELLNGYLSGFQDIDFRDGNVTVQDATQATYGTTDEYLTGRIANTHLHPASAFNKAQTNWHGDTGDSGRTDRSGRSCLGRRELRAGEGRCLHAGDGEEGSHVCQVRQRRCQAWRADRSRAQAGVGSHRPSGGGRGCSSDAARSRSR